MKLSQLKAALTQMDSLSFVLPDGSMVPAHFHVTEIGASKKVFIDCGGTKREENKATFQLWTSIDTDHRLKAQKLVGIIDLAAPLFTSGDPEVEIEYQGNTIEKYGLELDANQLTFQALHTDCLAKDNCGIPMDQAKVQVSNLADACCSPGGACC